MTTKVKRELGYQVELLDAIFNHHSATPESDLQIYQHNLYMTAARSLSLSYPVIHKMIGDRALQVLSRRLLSIERPGSGDWADWGAQFSHLLAISELHQEHPYLTQMAKLEWAFHLASRSRVEELDTESLQLLSTHDLDDVAINMQESLALVSSEYPLLGLWRLHKHGEKDHLPNKIDLGIALNRRESGFYVIYQSLNGPQVLEITREYFHWINGIKSRKNIGVLLDEFPNFDFSVWLSESIKYCWLVNLCD